MNESKIKYVLNKKLDWSIDDLKPNVVDINNLDFQRFDQVILLMEGNSMIQGFQYLHNNEPLILPEPEPSIMHFLYAEESLEKLINLKEELLSYSGVSPNNISQADSLFRKLYPLAVNYIVNLSVCIEAFNNRVLPKDFIFNYKKKEKWDTIKIQRHANYETKMKKIIPAVFDKSFVEEYTHKYEVLLEMKNLRDKVIHTKTPNGQISFRDTFRKFISFDYKKAYDCTKDYMNFYYPDWIDKLQYKNKEE